MIPGDQNSQIIVPHEQLDADILRSLVEEFITREGTDYGLIEIELPSKVEQVLAQIRSGDVFIAFDQQTESVNFMPRNSLTRHSFSF